MKIIILASYLLWLIVEGMGMGHRCREPVPENCQNNPRINLSKNNEYYRLSLCSEGTCLPGNHQEWIECSEVCEMCRSLLGSRDCSSEIACEQQVDSYLNSYCTSALVASTVIRGPTTTITTTQMQAQTTITRVQTTTSISTVTITPARSSSSSQSGQTTVSVDSMVPSSQASSSISSVQRAEFALAALFGLAIIVLMAVIAGWVLTYSIMKKKARENNGTIRTGFPASFNAKKYFKNPAYESSSDTLAPPTSQTELEESLTPEQTKFQKAKYDRIVVVPPSQIEKGRKYDVLNRTPTFRGADPSVITSPQCVQNGNKVEEQDSITSLQYSYNQLSRQNTSVENQYCTTRLAG